MTADGTSRRQITDEEREVLVDLNLAKASKAMGLGDESGVTLEKWVDAMEHVNRAAALMKEAPAKLKTTEAKAKADKPAAKS